MRIVNVSAGAVEYASALITADDGSDISADAVSMSLGSYSAPGTWVSPSSRQQVSTSVIRARLLIGPSTAPGDYWLWVKLTDTSETVPLLCANVGIRVI